MGQKLHLEERAKAMTPNQLETQIQVTCESMHEIYLNLSILPNNQIGETLDKKREYEALLQSLRKELKAYDDQYNSRS